MARRTATRLKVKRHLKRPPNQFLRFYEDELDRGQVMTVREAIRFYWENKPLAPTSRVNTRTALGPILTELGHYRISDIDANVMRLYCKARYERPVQSEDLHTGVRVPRGKASDQVLRFELKKLKAVINFAIMQGMVEGRYAPKFPMPSAAAPKDVWITRDVAREILRLARLERRRRPPTSYKVYIFAAIAIFTGARKSAIQSLKWSDIDFDTGTIDFRDPDSVNSIKRRGVIRMMPELRQVLLEAQELNFNRTGKYVLGDRGGQQAYKPFRRFLDRHGYSHVTPHTLRHSWTTWAVQDGVPFKQIADYLRVSVDVLERVYAHHDPNHLSPAFNRSLFGEEFAEVLHPSAT